MSWKATAKVKELSGNLTRSEKLVLLILADYHNEKTGRCDPKVEDLAEDALLGPRRVQQLLTRLQEKAFIIIEGREGGRRRSAQYWLTCIGDSPLKGEISHTERAKLFRPTPVGNFAPGAKSPTEKGEISHPAYKDEPQIEPQVVPQIAAAATADYEEMHTAFVNGIGTLPFSLIAEFQEYTQMVPKAWFLLAITEAVERADRPSWKFVKAVLDRCVADNRPPGPRPKAQQGLPEDGSLKSQVIRRFDALAGRN